MFLTGIGVDIYQHGIHKFPDVKFLNSQLEFVFINFGKIQDIVDEPEKVL